MSNLHASHDDQLADIQRLLGESPVAEALPAREGLPPTFRMRADAHYVELLDAVPPRTRIELVAADAIELRDGTAAPPVPALLDSIRRHGVLQPLLVQHRNGRHCLIAGSKRLAAALAAGLRDVPCIVCHADDEAAEALAAAVNTFAVAPAPAAEPPADATAHDRAELARSLSALGACADLLGNPAPALTAAVVLDLLRAEIRRANTRLQAMRVIGRDISFSRKPVRVRVIVDRVVAAIECERRLRGAVLDTHVEIPEARLDVDEEFLVGALSGLLIATFDLVDARTPLRVGLRAEASAGGDCSFVVSQDAVSAPDWERRADGRPRGGAPDDRAEPLAVAAARRVVEACEGTLTVVTSRRGTGLQVRLPTVA